MRIDLCNDAFKQLTMLKGSLLWSNLYWKVIVINGNGHEAYEHPCFRILKKKLRAAFCFGYSNLFYPLVLTRIRLRDKKKRERKR